MYWLFYILNHSELYSLWLYLMIIDSVYGKVHIKLKKNEISRKSGDILLNIVFSTKYIVQNIFGISTSF